MKLLHSTCLSPNCERTRLSHNSLFDKEGCFRALQIDQGKPNGFFSYNVVKVATDRKPQHVRIIFYGQTRRRVDSYRVKLPFVRGSDGPCTNGSRHSLAFGGGTSMLRKAGGFV